ncbi:esterase family protein [Corynebacterium sp. 320]|uniref:alpha/beta hydrolase n=1 Tax=Corynebacterium TaxID=1716 RepID=UPI00125CB7D5|nr:MULTISPECIES: alpha/beta hydrolase family protein [Corynebacterium]KAB1504477.1 esterase family protein [Corynebacterium sp. 320]KAB3528613.1 esterase family protein [Corynebacterium sp. 250]QNP92158.1 esterase family protein [Corynebacterium zhongnanshanii]
MKRSIFRVTAATLAALAPVSIASVAPATAGTPVDQIAGDQYSGTVPAGEIVAMDDEFFAGKFEGNDSMKWVDSNREEKPIQAAPWVEKIKKFRNILAHTEDKEFRPFDNVHVYVIKSHTMNRLVPVAVIQPRNPAQRDNAPTQYLLNGADGGEGGANWIVQTDVIEYFGGNPYEALYGDKGLDSGTLKATKSPGIGANIVIPMSGAFSYYTDWVNEEPELGGKQLWETFMTQELPKAIEPALKANGKRGIAGLSMSGSTVLNYAQHHKGLYDTIGSFSGCASATTGLGPAFIDITLNRGGTNMQTMWGGPFSERARYNDALLNAEKLRGQENIYVSNATGLAGPYDILSAPRIHNELRATATVLVEGGAIEAATNGCTHELAAKTNALGIPVTYNFRPQGTHQWGYWQDDMRAYWPVMTRGLGTAESHPQPENDPYQDAQAGTLVGSATELGRQFGLSS